MTTKTPTINDHGEETKKPQFGPGSDDANTTGNPSDPRGDVAAGDSSNPRGDKPEKSLSDDQLAQKESNTNGTESSLGSDEKSGFFKGEESPGGLTKLKGRLTKNPRNKLMIGLIAGVLGFGGFAGFTIVQGPLEFIHFAQIMQKFHFRANEDFGDDMAMRRLVYALGGEGERGRLGATLNVVADRWEKKLAQTTGLRPVYNKTTGVFAGFEVVDEKLAANLLKDLETSGGKTTLVRNAGSGGIKGTKNNKNPIDPNRRFIDFRGQSVPESVKRSVISRVGKNTGTHALTGSLGSRLLKKRARVNFSPLTGKIRKYSDILAEKRAQKDKLRQDLATQDKIGVDSTKLGTVLTNGVDQNGNPITDPNAQQVAQDGAEAIQDFQNAQETPNGQTPDSIKTKIIAGLKPSPAAIVGVLCSARSFGKDIPKYRYTHIILPVMRLGVRVIAAGNGVMAGKKVSLAELEAIHDTFYNSDTKTSWSSASTIQAEFGKKSSRPSINF